jgi:hypothetical protein
LPKAAANAAALPQDDGTSFASLLKEGLAMKKSQDLSWAQMAMAANAPMMTKAAIVDGHLEVGILPTGQGVGAIDDLPDVPRAHRPHRCTDDRAARPSLQVE